MTVEQFAVIVAALTFVVWRLSLVAGRLDRVHIRRDQALISLRLQLAWRSSSVARLVTLNVLDPVSTEILAREIAATSKAATNSDEQYFAAESELTHALCHIFDDESDASELMASMPEVGDVVGELAQACRRVALARRFHNDAVGSAQLLHKRKIVRYLRLAGRTPWPVTVDMYDQIPVGLGHVE